MTEPVSPRTSVILCSAGRSSWFDRAVQSVLAQTDGDLELLVVVDRDAPTPDLPGDDRIRVIQGVDSAGAARAAGLREARGELLAFCDDDDEWREDHLRVLRQAMLQLGVELVYGDSEISVDDGAPGRGWSRDYDVVELAHGNYIFATDVLTTAEAARRAGGFDPSLTCYEDWDLWLRMSLTATFRHVRQVVGRRRWHEEALLAYDDWEKWEQIYRRHQARVTAMGLRGRLAVVPAGARHARFHPETWTSRRELIWQSRLSPAYGYGLVGGHLLRAVQRQGIDVRLAPSRDQVPEEFEDVERADHWGRLAFYYDLPGHPGAIPVERVISYFMWESDRLPDKFVEQINRWSTLQLVPCHQNADSFRRSGVDVPIEVLHHGVDPGRFPLVHRPRRTGFTFGTFSDLSSRKGIDVLVRAFVEEFRRDEPVRLVLKGHGAASAFGTDHPGIRTLDKFLDPYALQRWLASLDAFVLPSRGEGFGLTGLEAMATGLPLIATNWSGPAEYLDPIDSYPLDYELVDPGPRTSGNVEYEGAWAEPSLTDLRRLMRHVVEHPDEAREKGLAASRRVHDEWTWDIMATRLTTLLDGIAGAG